MQPAMRAFLRERINQDMHTEKNENSSSKQGAEPPAYESSFAQFADNIQKIIISESIVFMVGPIASKAHL